MRIIFLSIFSLFLFLSAAKAQEWRLKPEIRTDSSFLWRNKPELQIPDPELRSFVTRPDQWVSRDTTGSITYPGSSRYYAKHPVDPEYSRNFIKTPDKSVKQYLIIKDPLTHKISK